MSVSAKGTCSAAAAATAATTAHRHRMLALLVGCKNFALSAETDVAVVSPAVRCCLMAVTSDVENACLVATGAFLGGKRDKHCKHGGRSSVAVMAAESHRGDILSVMI